MFRPSFIWGCYSLCPCTSAFNKLSLGKAGPVFTPPLGQVCGPVREPRTFVEQEIPYARSLEEAERTEVHYRTQNAQPAFPEARNTTARMHFSAQKRPSLSLIGRDEARQCGTVSVALYTGADWPRPTPGATSGGVTPASGASQRRWPIPLVRRRTGSGSAGSAGGWGDGDAILSALEGPGRCRSRRGCRVTWHSRRFNARAGAAPPVVKQVITPLIPSRRGAPSYTSAGEPSLRPSAPLSSLSLPGA